MNKPTDDSWTPPNTKEKPYLFQKLSVDIAMFIPPPIMLADAAAYQIGVQDGEKSAQKRIKELEEKLQYADRHLRALANDVQYTLNQKTPPQTEKKSEILYP